MVCVFVTILWVRSALMLRRAGGASQQGLRQQLTCCALAVRLVLMRTLHHEGRLECVCVVNRDGAPAGGGRACPGPAAPVPFQNSIPFQGTSPIHRVGAWTHGLGHLLVTLVVFEIQAAWCYTRSSLCSIVNASICFERQKSSDWHRSQT